MSRFFRKYSFVFLFVSLFSVEGRGQVLDNANLNLNSGGYINDVTYDSYRNYYIVVGNFTTVNGFARKNIAFLNGTTLAVETAPHLIPLSNIDGEIRTVEITRTFTDSSPDFYTYHLFIGGNFQTITIGASNYTRKGIAKLTSTLPIILPISYTNFIVSSWNADLDMTSLITGAYSEGVDDILISNDTVIFCGKFLGVNSSTTGEMRDGIAAFYLNGNLILDYPEVAYSGSEWNRRFYEIQKEYGYLYLAGYVNNSGLGNGRLIKLGPTGTVIPSFSFDDNFTWAVYSIDLLEDSLLIISADYNSESAIPDGQRIIRKSNGSAKSNHSLQPYSDGYISQIAGPIRSLAVYENLVFAHTDNVSKYLVGVESESEGPLITVADWNAAVPGAITPILKGNLHISQNKLFVSGTNLAVLSGQPHLRLGAYCLEPHNPKIFTVSDSTVCPFETITYTIPSANYAAGYRWEYTGVGADFEANGSIESGPIDIDDIYANSVQVFFSGSSTSGQLKVTPYSYCNGTTKLFSNTITTNITVSSAPNSIAGNDTSITCYNSAIQLYGYSDSTNIDTFLWDYPGSLFDTLGQFETVTSAGNYIFKVTNTNGCSNYDTVQVTLNKIQPTATPPPPPYELSCLNPVEDFLGTTTTPNTIAEWYQDSTTFFPNPISVNTIGTYYFRVTDTLNGCFKDTGIVVSNNITPPDIAIVGYPTIGLPLETLTCDLDTLNLVCTSSTPNSTASWINSDTSVFYGDLMTISNGGIYHLFATNNTNGCTISLNINIAENFSLHPMTTPADGLLNCSSDSIILFGSSTGAGAVLEWTGSSISPSTNPLTVYDPGWYYLSAENLANGCKTIDSVLVSQDNSITVFAGNDTLVCNNATVPLNATYTGTISGINYLWSNGGTSANTSYTAGTQPYTVVQITGDGGCVGTDTVHMNLPPTPVVNFEGFKPCDDGPSGQIVATPVSGIEPFTYSIDNGLNYQSSSVFNGLYIGDYPIIVRDSVNCEYNFTATIDENSSLPSPAFLFSTYNFETDTVVIIDVSNPPTDSTFWLFPNELLVLDNNPLSPMILLPDTGTFQITMQAYYGNCLVELSKLIYASPFDSLAATQYNLNGIKSIELYPNPTTGNFTVEVEFYKSQRAALVVQDMLANTYVLEEYDESFIITQDIYLDGTVIDGTYVLKVVSEFDSASITFILAR